MEAGTGSDAPLGEFGQLSCMTRACIPDLNLDQLVRGHRLGLPATSATYVLLRRVLYTIQYVGRL